MKYYRGNEPEDPLWVDFLCGLLGGAMGFLSFPGWLFVYWGWFSLTVTLLICASVGLILGGWLVWGRIKARKTDV